MLDWLHQTGIFIATTFIWSHGLGIVLSFFLLLIIKDQKKFAFDDKTTSTNINNRPKSYYIQPPYMSELIESKITFKELCDTIFTSITLCIYIVVIIKGSSCFTIDSFWIRYLISIAFALLFFFIVLFLNLYSYENNIEKTSYEKIDNTAITKEQIKEIRRKRNRRKSIKQYKYIKSIITINLSSIFLLPIIYQLV